MIEILLVDDHPSVGEGTKRMIEQDSDLKVTVVTSGTEALELLKSRTFDVLMFDLNIPVINGLELTRRVRAKNSDTPVIIYTGSLVLHKIPSKVSSIKLEISKLLNININGVYSN